MNLHKKYIFISFLFIVSFQLFLYSCALPINKKVTIHILKRADLAENTILENQLKEVYLSAFATVYKDFWSPERKRSILNTFDGYWQRLKSSDHMALVIAYKHDAIAGWALFYKENTQAILEILCVNPAFWRQGIGKQLVYTVKDIFPAVTKVAVVTYKINSISPQFYESLGFKKTGFMLPEYNAHEMQEFEWEIPNDF